ncbi:hypothetical protein KNE206_10620 [Kitasatospora sp. NE20-6]|uniref:hypothetical protein n=1 Tax=Kitasatospora sp. NE20-6 TaxID=2859066 RepID=UPI0034DC3C3A
MSAHRLIATAALLAAATLALTACDPDGTGPDAAPPAAGTTASTTAPAPVSPTTSTGTTPSGTPSAKATVKPSAARSTDAKPSGTGTPTADCTTAAQHPGHKVVGVVAATATGVSATPTRFVCGPDIENDGYYATAGTARSYAFAPGATAELFAMGGVMAPQRVPLTDFAAHAEACAHNTTVAEPYACYGGFYDITTDSAGRITAVSELFHP